MPLNVSIIIHSLNAFLWQEDAINRIQQLDFVKVSKVIVSNIPLKKLSIPYGILSKIDRRLYQISPFAFNITKLELDDSDIISLEGNSLSEIELSDEHLSTLKKDDLDIIINLNSRPLSKTIFSIPKYGVWDIKISGSNFGGFWEVVNNKSVSEISLVTNPQSNFGGKLLYRSFSSTEKYSFRKNWNNIYWKIGTILSRSLKQLNSYKNPNLFFDNLEPLNLDNFNLSKIPNGVKSLSVLSTQIPKITQKFFEKRKYLLQWYLLIKKRGEKEFKKLIPPIGHIWADPFLVEQKNKLFVFVEEVDTNSDKGFISVLELDMDLAIQKHHSAIIKRPYHLSYPCIFTIDEKMYMIPESFEAKKIQLFECIEFPHRWEHKLDLMDDVIAFDATPYYKDGVWYLFVGMMEHPGESHSDELFIFYTEDILNPNWKAFKNNPVISDVRKARPAGHFFIKDGQLMRPAQDGSEEYGYAIVVNKVKVLEKDQFSEEVVQRIDPEPKKNIHRRHTLNSSKSFVVQDGFQLTKK